MRRSVKPRDGPRVRGIVGRTRPGREIGMVLRLMRILTLAAATLLPVGAALAEAPAPTAVTPDLVAAAVKDGKAVWYTSVELETAEKVGKAFEAKYPGVALQVERSGA